MGILDKLRPWWKNDEWNWYKGYEVWELVEETQYSVTIKRYNEAVYRNKDTGVKKERVIRECWERKYDKSNFPLKDRLNWMKDGDDDTYKKERECNCSGKYYYEPPKPK